MALSRFTVAGLCLLALVVGWKPAHAAPCAQEDLQTQVPGLGHIDILRAPALADATATLIRQVLRATVSRSDTVR